MIPFTSAQKINRLPDELVNEIAAGEVVERPASIIKECVENSLDAGATQIEVHLKNGGLEEIRIIDNGVGILQSDLPLALERHATSKIRSALDLTRIESFGFRGEALASMAQVSDLELSSRTQDSESGYSIHSSFGKLSSMKPVGMPPGTKLIVKNLFKQLPARFKFMRSSSTEYSYCAKLLKEIAAGNPRTTFALFHESRQMLRLSAPTHLERYQECFKPAFEPIEIKEKHIDFELTAYLSPAEYVQEKGELFVYLNGRPIKNRIFQSAVRNAYLEALGPHHDPSGVVFLTVKTDWVDPNVHPQKLEVRCLYQEKIYGWLINVLRKTLPAASQIETLVTEKPQVLPMSEVSTPFLIRQFHSEILVLSKSGLSSYFVFHKLNDAKTKIALPVPILLSTSLEEKKTLSTLLPYFQNYGIEMEDYGNGDFAIRTTNSWIPESALVPWITAIVKHAKGTLTHAAFLILAAESFPLHLTEEEMDLGFSLALKHRDAFKGPSGKPLLWSLPHRVLKEYFNLP